MDLSKVEEIVLDKGVCEMTIFLRCISALFYLVMAIPGRGSYSHALNVTLMYGIFVILSLCRLKIIYQSRFLSVFFIIVTSLPGVVLLFDVIRDGFAGADLIALVVLFVLVILAFSLPVAFFIEYRKYKIST
jgi:hypothetical protein